MAPTPSPSARPAMNKAVLTGILITPVLIVAILIYTINGSISGGTRLSAPPIGAGAGHTGMSNEYMGIGAATTLPDSVATPASTATPAAQTPAPPGAEPVTPITPEPSPAITAPAATPTGLAAPAPGTITRLELVGGAGRAASMVRDAQVWLPPGYDDPTNAARRYPVLYMLDGQNMFETPPGGFGTWHAGATAARLIAAGTIEPLIIVGIPHAGMHRADEYLPFAWGGEPQPSGQAFEAWVLGQVMPRVERAFRVASGPENTGIGGASFGGVASLYIATRHPEVFGVLLAESVSRMDGPGGAFSLYIDSVEVWPRRVFVGMGGSEARASGSTTNAQYVDWANSIERRARATLQPPEVVCRVVPEAAHNEEAWAARFGGALEFLFPRR